ncbi:MAG: zinc-binding dehydrogenase [Streptosporangiales bacterium]|nr:zinc-binding dehydrogenase [Streptosporangiales bacterium]
MQAIQIHEPGGPEVLSYETVPDPSPGPGEVVIEVAAAGVNRPDVMQRKGLYPPPPGAPPYLGLECSGRVIAVGDDVSGVTAGSEVCALLAGGGYAERVAVPAGQVMPVPAGVSTVDAAALPEVTCTVWSMAFMQGHLAEGETLLVHGGSSGIGTFAIQLAKARGARVIVTAGSAEKLERCRELGADGGINYREEDFPARVKELTDGAGADVILDIMGAKYLAGNLESLAVDGRLVIIGLQGGRKAEIDLDAVQSKRLSVSGARLRPRQVDGPAGKARIVSEVVEHVWPLVAGGSVRPIIDRVLPMSEASEAHRVMEASEHVGKILLTP